MGPSVLVLEASVGSGHTRATEAIAAALEIENPESVVGTKDILEEAGWIYRAVYRSFYVSLARHAPILLDGLYTLSDSLPPWCRTFLFFLDRREFSDYLEGLLDCPPDLVICTHFLPLEILSGLRRKGPLPFPVWGVVTDVHPHGLWIYPGIDRYVVPTSRSASELLSRTEGKTEIDVLGIPVHPEFETARSSGDLKSEWGVPFRPTILILSGGQGVGSLVPVLDSFREEGGEALNIVAVAGKNKRLLEQCLRWARDHESVGLWIHVLGFVGNIHEWMTLSDVVITKPGGLSVFESLSLGKPLLLLPPRGGQERLNRDTVVQSGAGVALRHPEQAGPVVRRLLGNRTELERMSENSKRLGKPGAARTLARLVADVLPAGAGRKKEEK